MEKDRTYLLILSILIIANNYIDLTINQINVLGNDVNIDNPRALGYMVLIIWLYFFYRFIHHIYKSRDIFDAFDLLEKKRNKYIQESISKHVSGIPKSVSNEDLMIESFQNMKKIGFLKYSAELYQNDEGGGQRPLKKIEIGPKILFKPYSKTFFYWVIKDKTFSDFVIPLFVAGFALANLII